MASTFRCSPVPRTASGDLAAGRHTYSGFASENQAFGHQVDTPLFANRAQVWVAKGSALSR